MSLGKVEAILNPGRMLADGIPYPDFAEALARVHHVSDWFGFWADKGERYEELGEQALTAGHLVSAGEWLWQASLSFHYAQFMWFHEPEKRERGQLRKAQLYSRAAPHLVPPAERVDVPFEGHAIPGYLRLPPGSHGTLPAPCVLVLGGLESTKEESYLYENMLLRRGLATFAFDGPGQGEMFFQLKLQPDFERYASAVADYLTARPEIDPECLGLSGRSLGGHYAVRAAATDGRFRACVDWGGFFDMTEFDAMPPHTREGFLYVAGLARGEEGKEYLRRSLDLADVAAAIRRPLYALHGRHDALFSMRQIEKLTAAAGPSAEIVVEDEGDHCCHNMAHLVRPRMADWLAARLRQGRPAARGRGGCRLPAGRLTGPRAEWYGSTGGEAAE